MNPETFLMCDYLPFGYLTTLIIINPNKTLTHVILTVTLELSMCCFNRIVSIPILAILEATHPISETTLVAICQTKVECLAITEIWVGWGIAMIGGAIWEEWAVRETTMEKWRECADFKIWYNRGFPLKELLNLMTGDLILTVLNFVDISVQSWTWKFM